MNDEDGGGNAPCDNCGADLLDRDEQLFGGSRICQECSGELVEILGTINDRETRGA